jgi:hypothetical protein
MKDEDERALRQMLLDRKPLMPIADKAVTIVRQIADRQRALGTIGKQLSVVALNRDDTKEVWSRYYPESAGFQMYAPDSVVGINKLRRQAIADFSAYIDGVAGPELWAIPITRKNAPCPCSNGKRYKDCHGRSQPIKRKSEARIQKDRMMRVALRARQENGVSLTDEEMTRFIGEQWPHFARFAYSAYCEHGRGAIFINLATATTTGAGLLIDPIYLAKNSQELELRGGWPHDQGDRTIKLISSYDPARMVIFIIAHKSGRINTMHLQSEDTKLSPQDLYLTVNRPLPRRILLG